MKEIFESLEKEIKKNKDRFKELKTTNKFLLYNELNRIAYDIGKKNDFILQINFLSSKELDDIDKFGKRNLNIIIDRNKRKFSNLTIENLEEQVTKIIDKSEIKEAFRYEGREGYKIILKHGRIDILPGSILLWCDITDKIIELVDWIFKVEHSN